jgi:hypothetical protein
MDSTMMLLVDDRCSGARQNAAGSYRCFRAPLSNAASEAVSNRHRAELEIRVTIGEKRPSPISNRKNFEPFQRPVDDPGWLTGGRNE